MKHATEQYGRPHDGHLYFCGVSLQMPHKAEAVDCLERDGGILERLCWYQARCYRDVMSMLRCLLLHVKDVQDAPLSQEGSCE